jgi:hypothetical protein
VNEILSNLRRAQISTDTRNDAGPVIAPTMPPNIRNLLDIPETPAPRPRGRRRIDANGRRLPAGPAPPRSWLQSSIHAGTSTLRAHDNNRIYPEDVGHLPNLPKIPRLVGSCLMELATNWEYHKVYQQFYLPYLPTLIREALLSYVAVYGPENGIGSDGLESILGVSDIIDKDPERNDTFSRLDLSGSIGRSVSFKQIQALVMTPKTLEPVGESWDSEVLGIPMLPKAILPPLTHLSISHPPPNISWGRFLSFAEHIPTVTHLSLAHWPVPCHNPNSKTTKMHSEYVPPVQYGASNIYSHSLDDDWSEATSILRRLSQRLYCLVYLDLDGCTSWAPALRFDMMVQENQAAAFSTADTSMEGTASHVDSIDWVDKWGRIQEIRLRSGYMLEDGTATNRDVFAYKRGILEAMKVQNWIRAKRGWIDVKFDSWDAYDDLLSDCSVVERRAWNERLAAIKSGGINR